MKDENILRKILENVASVSTDVGTLKEDVRDIRDDIKDMNNKYITKELLDSELKQVYTRFNPSRTLIFSLAGVVLLSFVGAITAFFIK